MRILTIGVCGAGTNLMSQRQELFKISTESFILQVASFQELGRYFSTEGALRFERPRIKLVRSFCDSATVAISANVPIISFRVQKWIVKDHQSGSEGLWEDLSILAVPYPTKPSMEVLLKPLEPNSEIKLKVFGKLQSSKQETVFGSLEFKTVKGESFSFSFGDFADVLTSIRRDSVQGCYFRSIFGEGRR